MSVVEIKEELRRLSPGELSEIEVLVAELQRNGSEAAPRVREVQPSDPEFRAAADHVFHHYHDLLRRLAD